MTPDRVLMFEDNPAHEKALIRYLGKRLADADMELVPYDDSIDVAGWGNRQFRDHLESLLLEPQPVLLTLIDWDITMLDHPIQKEFVQGLCDQLGIPVCMYVNQASRTEQVKNMKRWQENLISLDPVEGAEAIADRCFGISTGFKRIRDELYKTENGPDLKEALYNLVRPPSDAAAQLNQYAWGDTSALQVSLDSHHARQYATLSLGSFIFNRILQFPGVLLNPVAAASYLGIDVQRFMGDDVVRAVFDEALYQGPFSEVGPFWWTTKLDALLYEHTPDDAEEVLTGLALARQQVGENVDAVQCTYREGPHEGAGLYCILTRQPVCADHSAAPGQWLPPGADLCRIEKTQYDEIGPWLHL